MFDVGFWELVVIGVVALLVVGPDKLPGLARQAGLWLGRARRLAASVKAEIKREIDLEDVRGHVRDIAPPLKDVLRETREALTAVRAGAAPAKSAGETVVSAPSPLGGAGTEAERSGPADGDR